MKITKLELVNFRGFPGTAVYDFEFLNAKNLFIYGENGSGKSSLFLALQEFFNNRRGAKPFSGFKNDNDPANPAGRITLHFDDGTMHTWTDGADRPVSTTPIVQTARQVGCFDYRSLLETNFTHKTDAVNLFYIAVNTLVPHMEVPVGGRTVRIDDLWQRVRSVKPANHRGRNIKKCEDALKMFNEGFEPIVTPLIDKATQLLATYFDSQLSLAASYRKVRYNEVSRQYENTDLMLSVRRDGAELLRHHNILNEARLSAIGLVIYLAGLLLSVPWTSQYPKLLVLDDVLVGIDMANRVPVLRILKEQFADWQIVLMTHDQVWYEMVMMESGASKWSAYELWLADDGVTPTHRKYGCNVDFFLDRAQGHLGNHDYRAAGLYARAGFEWKVKGFCDKRAVAVPYSKDPRKIKIEAAWVAAKKRAVDDANSTGDATQRPHLEMLFAAVDSAKKVVLNPLSHSTPQPLAHNEVQEALDAVIALKFFLEPVTAGAPMD